MLSCTARTIILSRKTEMTIIGKILLIYFLILVVLLVIQNRLIFRPTRNFPFRPAQFGLKPEEIFFSSSDGTRLHGWFFDAGKDAPCLLFCHGNAGNISDRLANVKLLLKLPVNVFIFDYRGYGKSEGSPTEAGVYEDAESAWRFVHEKKGFAASRIVVFGRSLGGAVAAELALRRPLKALILESTFFSLKDLVGKIFPYALFYPFIPDKFNTGRKIGKVHVPLFIIHGDQDRTVPWSHGKKLFDTANTPKKFWLVKGAHHTDAYEVAPAEYLERLRDFILTSR